MSERPRPQAHSSGGVVYRHLGDEVEIVLCGRIEEGLWALPKGTIEQGETIEETALREVEEETGLSVAIEDGLGEVRYGFLAEDGLVYDKRVSHHLMVATGGDVSLHDAEYDEVRWLPVAEALRLMRYAGERDIVERAVRLIRRRRDER